MIMEHILREIKDFNKSQIETYKINNKIEILFGKVISEEIFCNKMKEIIDFVKNFRNYKLSYSQGRVYKTENIEIKTYNNKRNTCKKSDVMEKKIIYTHNYDILVMNILEKEIEIIPIKKIYEDEYEYDEIIVTISNNIELIFETNKDMNFIKLKINLEKELPYTYQDEIIENLKDVFELLEGIKID